MQSPAYTVQRTADVAVERLFDTVVAEDVLPKVLHRWGPIPAVRATRERTGPWDTPGSERTVVLSDGSTARERVLAWERPVRFEYRVERFTSPLGRLVDHATGEWAFASAGPRSSTFRWAYSFHPVNALAMPPLRAFVATAWARYMAQCADLTVQLAAASRT